MFLESPHSMARPSTATSRMFPRGEHLCRRFGRIRSTPAPPLSCPRKSEIQPQEGDEQVRIQKDGKPESPGETVSPVAIRSNWFTVGPYVGPLKGRSKVAMKGRCRRSSA